MPAQVFVALLKQELNRDLPDAWVRRRGDRTKSRVNDVALRWSKVGVVEDIEELCTKLQPLGFTQCQILRNTEVPIRDPGTVEEAPVGVPELPKRFGTE